jgi:prefoldin subunit 5
LWALLNPNCNEENNWAVEYGICDIYDEYAIVRNYAEGVFERVYYTKNDENDSLEITNKERCYIVDVNENEKNALDNLHKMNNNTYEAIDESFTNMATELQTANENVAAANATIEERDNTINSLNDEISLNNTKIEELGSENATLIQEKNDAVALHTAATEQIASIQATLDGVNATLATVTAERDTLATFKKNIEDDEKKALIADYANQLPADVIDTYTENMDNYSIEDLDMKLTYELKRNHPEIFSKGTPPAYVPKADLGAEGGINAILARYKK